MGDEWVPTVEDHVDLAAGSARDAACGDRALAAPAESAVHVPFAGFGGEPAYPRLLQRAAVLIVHLTQNHPLPDGNKRAAFLLTARYLEANGVAWLEQDVERDAGMVERIAAGDVELHEVEGWIAERTHPL